MNPRRRLVALAVLLPTLMLGVPGAAAGADADELGVVTVLRQPAGGAVSVVTEIQPPPPAPLPADAARVTVAGSTVAATTAPLLDAAAPTAIVLDASSDGRQALSQALSGAAAFLLRLPATTAVTAVADATPPKNLTPIAVSPIDALQLIAGIRAGGARSTGAALDLALKGLPHRAGGRSLLLLQTTGPAPQDAAGLSDRLHAAGVVLAVATTTKLVAGWTPVARATGGLALGAAPDDLATAFDAVAQTLQSRSVVTFTPPPGATSASLRVRAGGGVLPAEVSLASGTPAPSPGSSGVSQRGTTSAPSGGFGWVVAEVAAGLALLALAVAAVLLRRRGRPSRDIPREGEALARVPVGAGEGSAAQVAGNDGEHPAEVSEGGVFEGDVLQGEVLEGKVLEGAGTGEGAGAEVAGNGGERHAEVLQGEVLEGEGAAAEVTGDAERPEVFEGAGEGVAPEVAGDGERPAEVFEGAGAGGGAAAEVAGDGERPGEVLAGEGAAAEVAGDGERPGEVFAGEDEAVAAEVATGDGEGPSPDLPPEESAAASAPTSASSSESDEEVLPRVRVFDVTNPAVPVEIKSPQAGDGGEGSGYVGHHRKGRHRPRLRLKPREDDDEEPSDPGRRDRSA